MVALVCFLFGNSLSATRTVCCLLFSGPLFCLFVTILFAVNLVIATFTTLFAATTAIVPLADTISIAPPHRRHISPSSRRCLSSACLFVSTPPWRLPRRPSAEPVLISPRHGSPPYSLQPPLLRSITTSPPHH
ncbi:hypothetical protein F2Q70_00043860 [Brassica cretica]|uniref:Uncharacterized protein n=1 Tax=Brassica cretica TaxID=69181 RepID=A0A8S9KFG9_BRACR|nr:hypothetical protein F2Q70_00043860 [Brassica cretica]